MEIKTSNLFFGLSVLFLCLVYFLLAFKNPFKTNSLVSNLEPYPDTLYYSVPAWNLVNGRGFKMSAYGHEIKKITPPIYSLYLIPFFALFGDIRSYYFANLLLSFVSILVFGCRKMKKSMPSVRKFGNLFARNLIKFLFGVKRKDLLCGYFAFSKDVYKKIEWSSVGYGVETEIAVKVARSGLGYKEIEVDTTYVDKMEGTSLLDAIRVLLQLPCWYFKK